MPASTDDLLAMLDRVAEKQYRCPLCGSTEGIYITNADWYYRRAYMPLTGGIIAWGDGECSDPPANVVKDIPTFLSCEADGVDHKELGSDFTCHWWVVPADQKVEWVYDDPRPKPDPEG